MKIALFGCSWMTNGPPHKDCIENGWIKPGEHMSVGYYFSRIIPQEWKVDCYALGGTGIQFSTYWLSKCIDEYDLLIFKATNWFRYSYYDKPYDLQWTKYKPNFRLTTLKTGNSWTTIAPSRLETLSKQHRWWLKTGMNEINQRHTYNIHLDYAKYHADFVYAHMYTPGLINVKDVLGEHKFQLLCYDDGDHFGPEGCKWEAKWLLTQLIKRGKLGYENGHIYYTGLEKEK